MIKMIMMMMMMMMMMMIKHFDFLLKFSSGKSLKRQVKL